MLTALRHVLGGTVPGRPEGPFLTWYDGDDRVELSRTTFDNWVAKTANWLRDELDIQPGDDVAVTTQGWQRVVAAFAVWAVGATLAASGTAVADLDVLAYPDAFVPMDPASPPDAEPDDRRVLVTDDGVTAALRALRGGGSVVVVRNADPATVERRAAQERAAY